MALNLPDRKSVTNSVVSKAGQSCVSTRVEVGTDGLLYPCVAVEDGGEYAAIYRAEQGFDPDECPHQSESSFSAGLFTTAVITTLMTPIYKSGLGHETPEQAIVAALDMADSFEWTGYSDEVSVIRTAYFYEQRSTPVLIDGDGRGGQLVIPRDYIQDVAQWVAANRSEFALDNDMRDRLNLYKRKSGGISASAAEAMLSGAAKPKF